MKHDKNGREYVDIRTIKPGDTIYADEGFDCMSGGAHVVKSHPDGALYIDCREGTHDLI